MAKKKTKSRKGGTGAAFKNPKSAAARRWLTARGNVVSKKVPKACAIVQSGPKKGKVRKGCKIRKHGAWCDESIIDRLPAKARDKRYSSTSKRAFIECK